MSLHRTSELLGVGLIRNASLLHLHRGILSLAFNVSLDIRHFEHSNMIEICEENYVKYVMEIVMEIYVRLPYVNH